MLTIEINHTRYPIGGIETALQTCSSMSVSINPRGKGYKRKSPLNEIKGFYTSFLYACHKPLKLLNEKGNHF